MDTKEAYDWVIRDLENKRERLRRELECNSTYMKFVQLETFIEDLQEEARQFVANNNRTSATDPPPPPKADPVAAHADAKTFRPRQRKDGQITLGDGTEKILETARKMHVSKIVVKLAEMGRKTNVKSLSSTLLQDPRKRFAPMGGNVFTLTRYYEDEMQKTRQALLPDASAVNDLLTVAEGS